ncbi:hypothetical protein LM13656_220119 [Listeria monocytogenes]|nr:hypothetical protein LM13656_220119 [Listeria monocytogenes]CUM27097.1 hypothetical protein LM900865_170121 [Listeria monocytogenes]
MYISQLLPIHSTTLTRYLANKKLAKTSV